MPLLNAFIESIVTVGFRADRGLTPEAESKDKRTIFGSFFQPSLLAFVTGDRAIYPQATNNQFIDPSYPPSNQSNQSSMTGSTISSDNSVPSSPMITMMRSTHRQYIIPGALNNLPMFCFPDGVRITYQREPVKIHHVVFTQEEGKRSYALVLTLQQIFELKSDKPDDDGIFQIEDIKTYGLNIRRPSASRIPIATDRAKLAQAAAQGGLKENGTHRSRKMPTAYGRYTEPAPAPKTRSVTPSDPNRKSYEEPTISSYMKSLSSVAAPPTRVSRSNSQSESTNSRSRAPSLTNSGSSTSAMQRRQKSTSATRTSSGNSITSKPAVAAPVVFDATRPFYLPHCVILISSQPYWTAMQETVSMIYDEIVARKIEISSMEYKQLIKNFAYLVCNSPVPPIPWERFSLSFNIRYDQSVLQFDPPISTDRTVLDLDLSILLLNLNIGKLLEVLSAIFTEQPIMFFSSNYSTLVTTLECLLYLIYPLKWMNIYVPLVPRGLESYYLEGPPGSYIMGAHSRHQPTVEVAGSCCTCNIDDQKNMYVPSNTELRRIPTSKLKRFTGPITKLLDEIKTARALQNTRSPIHLRIEKQREEERQLRRDTNNQIIDIFTDLMVDLCGDIFLPIYWKMNKQHRSPNNTFARPNTSDNQSPKVSMSTFDKETYLRSRIEGDEKDFYEEFLKTMAFQLLLEQEIKDTMSSTPFRQICQLRSRSTAHPIFHDPAASIAVDDDDDEDEDEEDDVNPLAEAMNGQFVLCLTDWTLDNNAHYLDSCIEVFTNELNNAQDEHSIAAITVYAFLRGCALLARGYLLEGLEDLYRIENVNLFPLDYIKTTIVPLLREASLLETFLVEQFYIRAADWKKIQATSTFKGLSIIDLEESGNVLDVKVPVAIPEDTVNENELLYPQFSDHVRRSYIAMDEETLQTLFVSLLYWVDPQLADAVKKNKNLLTTPMNGENQFVIASSASRGGNSKLKFTNLISSPRGSGASNKNPLFSFSQERPAVPAALYESFLDIWRQTNAEKVRMIRCLPEERRNQESILKISAPGVISKKDGPGQLILTQKRLYFLREAYSSAHLLTELKNIKTIEKMSGSKSYLKIIVSSSSSSLPRDNNTTVKSKTNSLERDGKVTLLLLFKSEQELDFWHTIVNEIFSGLAIANKQCDTSILNKASRHIALMDALAHINYNRSTIVEIAASSQDSRRKLRHHNEESLVAALNDFKILTEMYKSGAYASLPRTTREVLTRRLSPSINEVEVHPVRCVAFAEHRDQGRSSLWCAYGSKLKVYNVATWICDWKDLIFPSSINCMCLDNRSQLWVGCLNGQVFVVDTETYTVGDPLVSLEGSGGCQTIAYDADQDVMLIANQTGLVIPWDTTTWEQYDEFVLFDIYKQTIAAARNRTEATAVVFRSNFLQQRRKSSADTQQTQSTFVDADESASMPHLPEQIQNSGTAKVVPTNNDKLDRIQIYDERLFASYQNDYVLVFRLSDSGSYIYETLISVNYKIGETIAIDSFIVYKDQLWVATGSILHFFNVSTRASNNFYNPIMKRPIEDDRLVSMIGFSDFIWAGSLRGNIYVFLMHNYELYKTFAGHMDSVCCLSTMFDRYVISGASAKDRSVAIWNDVQPKTDDDSNTNSLGRTRSKTVTQTNLPRKMTITND